MKCSIQRGEAEFARMRKHSLFVLYNLYKDPKLKRKSIEKIIILAQAKHFTSRASNSKWTLASR